MTQLAVQLLGTFVTAVDGVTITRFRSDKIRALLAYLVVESDRPHRREMLANLLWSDWSRRDSLRNLRKSLHRLRQALGEETADSLLRISQQTVQLDAAHLQLDVHQLQQAVADTTSHEHDDLVSCSACRQKLEAGVALYQGEFLLGFSLDDALEFSDWMVLKREMLHRQVLTALQQIATHYEQAQDFKQAQHFAAQQIALEPWHEAAHRQLMRIYHAAGQRGQALAQYETCCRILAEELGAEPSPTTEALFRAITEDRLEPGGPVTGKQQPEIVLKRPRHNLPRQFTTFVGRSQEIADILARLQNPACGLLTILGPGGVGKTRLAIEAAQQGSQHFRDGVWFVPLAPLSAVDDISATILASLGIPLNSQIDAQEQLLNYLKAKELLLVLDNFEHLLNGGVSLLMTILQQAQAVKILVTSRVALNLHAEWLYEIDGLTVLATAGAQVVEQGTAVQLFHQRVQQIQKPAPQTKEEAAAIARICQLVEGMPLAVELAAAQTHQTSYAEFAERLAQDMDVLATTMQDLPERQRSLRAVFDYSWQLLNAEERSVLSQLAIFRGGFTVAAAETVTGASLLLLEQLRDKSLVRQNQADRFDMHEVLRRYAGEKLEETAVNQFMQHHKGRYNSYFVSFLQEREATINGLAGRQAVMEIRQEIDNIRPVWHSIVTLPDLAAIVQSAPALVEYFSLSGQSREGDRLLQMAIQAIDGILSENMDKRPLTPTEKEKHRLISYLLSQRVRFLIKLSAVDEAMAVTKLAVEHGQAAEDIDAQLEARVNRGTINWRQGNFKAAYEQVDIASQLSKQAQNDLFKIRVFVQQGIIQSHLGDFAQARQYYEQALSQYEAAGIEGLPRIAVYINLGSLAISEGKYAEARKQYEQALDMYHQIGSEFGISMVLAYISKLAFHEQGYSEALTLGQQALERFQEIGEVVREAGVLLTLGNVLARLGQWEKARQHYAQALELSRSIRSQTSECEAVINLSLLAWQLGDFQEAFALSTQALQLTEVLADRNLHAYALAGQGRALAGMGQMREAAVSCEESLALRQELKQLHLAAEIEALLAYLYLNQGDLEQAGLYTERVVAYLRLPDQQDVKKRPSSKRTTKSNQNKLLSLRQLKGVEDPFRVYLICYQVLQAGGDERGVAVLDFAANLLHEQAALVNDANYKRSYLEDVPANRQILAARSKESAATVRGMAWVSGVGDR